MRGRDITESGSSSSLLKRICDACLDRTSADGIAVAVVNAAGHRGTAYASGELAAKAEDLGFVLGEGPCIDAFARSGPVLANDLGTADLRSRWPGFTEAADELGLAAVFAFPLQLGAVSIGTLALYGRVAGQLDGAQMTSTLRAADAAVLALLEAVSGSSREPSVAVDDRMYRSEVHQAAGMLAEQLHVSVGEAIVRLRAHAYAAGERVDEVARAVVRRQLRFVTDNGQAPPEKGSGND